MAMIRLLRPLGYYKEKYGTCAYRLTNISVDGKTAQQRSGGRRCRRY